MAKRNLREASATKDGLPRKAFAYAPTAEPSTWKLPYLTASGAPDPDHLPGAAAALSSGGFRGQKADIPASAAAAVKRKLRAAYKRWKGADAEIPDSIKEAVAEIGGYTIREAVILLDRAPTSAQVIVAPNGDTLVVPMWSGAFDGMSIPVAFMPTAAKQPDTDDDAQEWHDTQASWDVEDAADVIGDLVRLKKGEAGEADDQALLDTAIDNVVAFLKAEAGEIGQPPQPGETCELCRHDVACDCTICSCSAHGVGVQEARAFLADPTTAPLTEGAIAAIREVGRRNSKTDQARIQQTHDLMHDLGASHEKGKTYANMAESGDVVEVRIEATAKPVVVRFAEGGDPAGVIPVRLSEAGPLFDEANHAVWVTPIRPGWGNLRDKNYYPASTLREATLAGMFNNRKMFRDHPTKTAEKDLPERSVKDWFATTRESVWDEDRQEPRVLVKVHDDAAWRQWHDAPEQVAFSVLGGGSARPGSVDGRKGNVIESITKVGSLDWVTEAGAGGAIAFAESAADEEFDMDLQNLTAEQLREANPALFAALTKTAPEGDTKSGGDKPTPTPPTPTPPTPTPPTGTPVAESAPAWFTDGMAPIISRIEAIEQRDAASTSATKVAEAKTAAKPIVADAVAKTTLPAPAKAAVIARFAEAAMGEGQTFADEAALREAIVREAGLAEQMLAPFVGKSNVRGLGPVGETTGAGETTVREAVVKDLTTRWGPDAIPPKGKFVWSAEELSGGQPMAAVDTREAKTEPADAAGGAQPISEAGQAAQDRIAARLGVPA